MRNDLRIIPCAAAVASENHSFWRDELQVSAKFGVLYTQLHLTRKLFVTLFGSKNIQLQRYYNCQCYIFQ
jgi:hypothetical protein